MRESAAAGPPPTSTFSSMPAPRPRQHPPLTLVGGGSGGARASAAPEPDLSTLRLSPSELEAFVAAMSDVVLVLGRDGRYLRVATTAQRMLVRAADELIGRRLEDVLPPDTAAECLKVIHCALETGEVQDFQYTLEINGSWLWFDATVSPTREGTVVWVARDVSARREAEAALAGRERDVQDFFEAAFDGMLVCGPDLRCLDVNTRLCDLLGRSRGEILSLDYSALVDAASLSERPLRMEELFLHRRLVTERRLMRGDGNPLEAEIGTSLLDDGRILFVIRDVTERKQAEATIRALALVDELTGLYNRRGFLALAEREWERARRESRGALLVVFDLDDLKPINDTFGHAAGDDALAATASVLRATFRGADVVGRLGGDEFAALIVPGGASSGSATAASARLNTTAQLVRQRLERHLASHNAEAQARGRSYDLALSVGLSSMVVSDDPAAPPRPASLAALLAEGDAALYEEKRSRKQGRRA